MATRINTKFVLILATSVLTAVGIVGGLWVLQIRSDTGRNIKNGDALMVQGRDLDFFSGQLLASIFSILSGNFGQVLNILAVINLLAIPFSIYSIIIQRFVLKKWCTLCLAVQGTILLLCITFLYFDYPDLTNLYNLSSIGIVGFSLLIPTIVLSILLTPLKQAKKVSELKRKLGRFQRDKTLFNIKLAEEPKSPEIQIPYPTLIGNPNASNQIIMVTNPFCEPCKKMHKKLSELQKQFEDELNIQIILSIPANEGHEMSLFVKHFLSLPITATPDELEKALGTFYDIGKGKGQIEKWISDNPILNGVNEILLNEKITQHNEWLQKAAIQATPTLFFNGHLFPKTYAVDDLEYLI